MKIALMICLIAALFITVFRIRQTENERIIEAFEKDARIQSQTLEAMKMIPLNEISSWEQVEDETGSFSQCEECGYQFNNTAFFEIYTQKFCPHCGRYMINWSDHEKGTETWKLKRI